MSAQNDTQAAFMEAMNGLKEYAKVNGGFITKDDVLSYFKDLDLDDGKLQMVYGYLMANNIKIKGAASEDNEFLKMMETAEAKVCLPAFWCRKVIWQCCPISARSSGQTITNGKIRLKKEIRRICSKSFTALKKKSVNWLRAVLK